MAWHLASLWNRGLKQLGNGLLKWLTKPLPVVKISRKNSEQFNSFVSALFTLSYIASVRINKETKIAKKRPRMDA